MGLSAEEIFNRAETMKANARWNEMTNLYKQAADMGHAESQYNIANLYIVGGKGHSYASRIMYEAHRYYYLAAKQGHAQALDFMNKFTMAWYREADKKKVWKNMRIYTLRSATLGHVQSMRLAAALLYDGKDGPVDQEQAKYWFEKAVSHGDQQSAKLLKELFK